jgi:trk system potassium uptake protein TrkA
MLVEAGIEQADVFVAVASGDNRNILAAQKAREIYGVKRVVTRVKDPLRAELFARLGIQTFSPTKVGIELGTRSAPPVRQAPQSPRSRRESRSA